MNAATTFSTTAGQLAQIMFGCSAADLSKGQYYEGTKIPVRRVAESAIVTFSLNAANGTIVDSDGGWIAERFGTAGIRQARRIAAVLAAR